MRLLTHIKSLNETVLMAGITIILVVIFLFFRFPLGLFQSAATIVRGGIGEGVTYYGVPLTTYLSGGYYEFSLYDSKGNQVKNASFSSFFAEVDYRNIGRMENGKRVIYNEWVTLVYDNPDAVFKITGEIKESNCIYDDESCPPTMIVDNMEVAK